MRLRLESWRRLGAEPLSSAPELWLGLLRTSFFRRVWADPEGVVRFHLSGDFGDGADVEARELPLDRNGLRDTGEGPCLSYVCAWDGI